MALLTKPLVYAKRVCCVGLYFINLQISRSIKHDILSVRVFTFVYMCINCQTNNIWYYFNPKRNTDNLVIKCFCLYKAVPDLCQANLCQANLSAKSNFPPYLLIDLSGKIINFLADFFLSVQNLLYFLAKKQPNFRHKTAVTAYSKCFFFLQGSCNLFLLYPSNRRQLLKCISLYFCINY